MAIKELSGDDVSSLVGTRHSITGIEYPPNGLQPYYLWITRTLHLLAESSLGHFRVSESDDADTHIHIAPGKATISGTILNYVGETVDLTSYNNDVAHVWLRDNAGAPAINTGPDSAGWPAYPHIKLAEVTLIAGRIVQITDRRLETVFNV